MCVLSALNTIYKATVTVTWTPSARRASDAAQTTAPTLSLTTTTVLRKSRVERTQLGKLRAIKNC